MIVAHLWAIFYMKHSKQRIGVRRVLDSFGRQRGTRRQQLRFFTRRPTFELLEARPLLAADFGDAPDLGAGTGIGNYKTLLADNGSSHTIVAGLQLGANIDGDD